MGFGGFSGYLILNFGGLFGGLIWVFLLFVWDFLGKLRQFSDLGVDVRETWFYDVTQGPF